MNLTEPALSLASESSSNPVMFYTPLTSPTGSNASANVDIDDTHQHIATEVSRSTETKSMRSLPKSENFFVVYEISK